MALFCASGAVAQTPTPPDAPAVAITSEEYLTLPREQQLRIFNRELESSVKALSTLAPTLIDEGAYRFDGDSVALSDLVYNLGIFRTKVQVGGAYRDILQLQLSNTEDLIRRTEDSTTLDEADRKEFLDELTGQATDLRDLRKDMDTIEDDIRQFIQVEAPAIEEEYRLREEIGRNRAVIREFRRLQATMESIMSVVSDDDDTPQGVD